ncbi:hypothetical protein FDF18_10825 [Clostridium sporogenes]|nr:hypothetical protein [Clostridium sporogenes]NFF79191.1 hypothetical protein [Clostridium sporogenes]NFL78784.1 hypothetical protein [Clostridium sporogenes]NFT03780.1 hypothetical protein [Clostridium sporogenes]NFT32846.1 hypothetical protein [Clostridium sporogenes]
MLRVGFCYVFTKIKVYRDCWKIHILYNHLDGFSYIINIKGYT